MASVPNDSRSETEPEREQTRNSEPKQIEGSDQGSELFLETDSSNDQEVEGADRIVEVGERAQPATSPTVLEAMDSQGRDMVAGAPNKSEE